MEMNELQNVKRPSFFEEHKQAIKGFSVALAAVALIAAIYAGIKTGFFKGLIILAITNPVNTGLILATTLIAVAGVTWFVFFKDKSEDGSEVSGSSLSSGVSLKSLKNQHPLITKLYEFSLSEKYAYLQDLNSNLQTDGFNRMHPKQQLEVIAALIDVDLQALHEKGYGFAGKYVNEYVKILRYFPDNKDQEDFSNNLKTVARHNLGQIDQRASNFFTDALSSVREMTISQKYAYLQNRDPRLGYHGFDNDYEKSKKASYPATSEKLLEAAGNVNLNAFCGSYVDKKEFAKIYRWKICGSWNELAEQNSEYKPFYLYSLRIADQLDRIAATSKK